MNFGPLTHQVIFISTSQHNRVCSITVSAMNTTDMRTVYASFTHLWQKLWRNSAQLSIYLKSSTHSKKNQVHWKPNLHSEFPSRTNRNTRNRTKMVWRHNGTNLSATNTCHALEIKPHIKNDESLCMHWSPRTIKIESEKAWFLSLMKDPIKFLNIPSLLSPLN